MNKFIIYMATNKISGKAYVGKTINTLTRRRQGHHDYASPTKLCKESAIFHKAIASYGQENFEWCVLAECDDHEELNQLEIKFIAEKNTVYPNGYNMTSGGGTYGYQLKDETRAKISQSVSKLHEDPAYWARVYPKLKGLAPPNKGIPMSEAQKAKVSAAKKATYANPDYVNPNVGQKRTEEQKANIKAGQQGRMASGDKWYDAHKDQYTDEVRQKMREKKFGKKPANTKKVLCIETGQVFEGLSEASKALNVNRQSIYLQIKGKLKSAGGLHFKYLDILDQE